MQTTETEMEWLLKEPAVLLTVKERETFEWAVAAAKEVLTDEDWLADNEDAQTVEGQILDLRYRLEEQAYDMLRGTDSDAKQRAARRVLNSLSDKLEQSGYWTTEFHQ